MKIHLTIVWNEIRRYNTKADFEIWIHNVGGLKDRSVSSQNCDPVHLIFEKVTESWISKFVGEWKWRIMNLS